jgi:hypothetical protein
MFEELFFFSSGTRMKDGREPHPDDCRRIKTNYLGY